MYTNVLELIIAVLIGVIGLLCIKISNLIRKSKN